MNTVDVVAENHEAADERADDAHPDIALGKIDTESETALSAGAQISWIPDRTAFMRGVLFFSRAGSRPVAILDRLFTAVRELDVDLAVDAGVATQRRSA